MVRYQIAIIIILFLSFTPDNIFTQECEIVYDNIDQTNGQIYFNDFKVDTYGNIYITGSYSGTVILHGTPDIVLPQSSGTDIFVAKISYDYNPVWCQVATGTGGESAESIILDDDGNCYISGKIGRHYDNSGDEYAHFHPSLSYHPDFSIIATDPDAYQQITYSAFIAKYDNSGTIQWVDCMNSGITEHQKIGIFSNTVICLGNFIGGYYSKYFVLYDLDNGERMSEKWKTSYDFKSGFQYLVDTNGNIYVWGQLNYYGTTVDIHGYTISGPCYYLFKYTKYGTYLWHKTIKTTEFEDPNSFHKGKMYFDGNNSFYLFGQHYYGAKIYHQDQTNYISIYGSGVNNFCCKMDLNGNISSSDIITFDRLPVYETTNDDGLLLTGDSYYISMLDYNNSNPHYLYNNLEINNRKDATVFCPHKFSKVYFTYSDSEEETYIGVIKLDNEPRDFVALYSFYKSTIGDSWFYNAGWLDINTPLEDWYGVNTLGNDVVSISLPNNNLQGSIPENISSISSLNEISVQGNHIGGDLPDDFWAMPDLVTINLNDNDFLGEVPEEINERTNIQFLDIEDNEFTRLPNITGHTSLNHTNLNVRNNYFTFIDLEPNISLLKDGDDYVYSKYAPQKIIPAVNANVLLETCDIFEFPGFTDLGGDRYIWKKGQVNQPPYYSVYLDDSHYYFNDIGDFYCFVTNENVPYLTLTCGPVSIDVNYISGDVTCDKKVLAFDASLVLRHSVSLPDNIEWLPTYDWGVPDPWFTWRLLAGDVDESGGGLTPMDASYILQAAIGRISLPVSKKNKAGKTNVSVQKQGDTLSFISRGGLYAFALSSDKLSTNNNKGAIFVHPDMIMAENVVGNNYKIGLASAQPVPANEAFLKVKMNNAAENTVIDVKANYTQQQINLSQLSDIKLTQYNKGSISLAPNPFTNEQYLHLYLPQAAQCNITIYDTFGRVVQQLFKGYLPNGSHTIQLMSSINGIPLQPGVYIYDIEINKKRYRIKSILQNQ